MILHVSTREGRKGFPITEWVYGEAKKIAEFQTNPVDLRDLNLPIMAEPNHPKLGQYTHDYTKDWSKMVNETDVFIFVHPEYNYSIPPVLSNAFGHLFHEWSYKPVAFVGYGGISGGIRAMQQLKQLTTAPMMMPFEGVQIPFFANQINEKGVFTPTDGQQRQLEAAFDELIFLDKGMRVLRENRK